MTRSACFVAGRGRVLAVSLVLAAGALLGWSVGCNFDSALQRYCADNPRCLPDAGLLEVGPPPGLDAPIGPSGSGADAPDAEHEAGVPFAHIAAPKNCMSSSDCNPSIEVCHPTGHVCMLICHNNRTDCPPWLDNCADLPDQGNGTRVKMCTCAATSSCYGAAPGLGYRCNLLDGLCEPPCLSADDCASFMPPRTCDGFTTVCVPTCASNADCTSAATPHCDLATSRCTGCQSNDDCLSHDGQSLCSSSGACTGGSSPSPAPSP